LPDGAVVLRSADPELQLQGLRTALSLALGDRPATVYVFGEGRAVLAALPDSEAGRCLSTLVEAGIDMQVEGETANGTDANGRKPRGTLLDATAGAVFQQSF
jgi:hypothetical protein